MTTPRDIRQAILDFKNYGVCSANAVLALSEQAYITGHSQWFKPIPWAIGFYSLTESGLRYALAVEIDNLESKGADKLLNRDLFNPYDFNTYYADKLIFTKDRIETEITNGYHIEVGRAVGSDMSPALSHQMHPEYFPEEAANV